MPSLHRQVHCHGSQANALQNRKKKQTVEEEARCHNMRLASCGVRWLNSSSVFQINFSAGLTVWCSEIPHERQAQNR